MAQSAGSKGFGGRVAQERRLKAARDHRDIGKQDVAAAIGVSNSTYGRWEDGTLPDDGKLERLAAYFGVTPAWLRYGQEPREAAAPVPKVKIETGERKRMDGSATPTRAASASGGKHRK